MNIFKLVGTVAINRAQAVKDIDVIKKRAEGASTAMKRSFSKFSGYVKEHSAQIKAAGRTLTIFGGIATAAFAVSVKSAAAFEEQLANVSTMLNEDAMYLLPEYRDRLQDMSIEFGEATDTLSKGLYDILSASIDPAKALDVLAASSVAATAGLTDTGTAADAVTTVMNSYGYEAEDATLITDKLFAIVKGGKTTFGELAPAIGRAATTAAESGLDFDEFGAAISTCTRAGINTRETMTSIVGVLKAFLTPQEDAIDVAEEFGVTLNTTTLKTEGLTGVMKKLENASAEQLAQIFGNIRGLKGMMVALGDTEGYARDYALMVDSAGLAQEAFEKQTNTLSFQLKQLKQAFKVVQVEVGDALVPTIKKAVTWIKETTVKVRDWIKENRPLFETLVKVAAGLSGVILVLGPMMMILPGLIAALGLLKIAFIPFLVGGAILAGILKLSEYMNKVRKETLAIKMGIEEMGLKQLDAEIEALAVEANNLQLAMSSIDWGTEDAIAATIEYKGYEARLVEIREQLGLLYEARKKLTNAEEEGLDVSKEQEKIDELIIKLKEEIAESLEKVTVENEEAVKSFNKWEKVGANWNSLGLYFMGVRKNLKETVKENKEVIKEFNKWEKVGANWNSLGMYFMGVRESLGEVAIAADTAWDNWLNFFDNMKSKLSTTTTVLQNAAEAWSGAVQGAFANAITSLLNWKEINEQVQKDITANEDARLAERVEYNKNYKKKLISMLEGIVDANEAKNMSIEELESLMMTHLKEEWALMSSDAVTDLGKIDEKYEELDSGIREDMVTLKSIWKTFWEELKDAAITQLAIIIAQQAISALIAMGPIGWAILGLAFLAALASGFSGGGEAEETKALAGFDMGGLIKGFAKGGGTDTTIIAATPGEYVISKPMTDFIKSTGIVTSNLVNAIKNGARTPMPQYAMGGGISGGFAGGGVVPSGGKSIKVEKFEVNIFAQELDDDTIANAGSKMYVEFKRQLEMRGESLMEE